LSTARRAIFSDAAKENADEAGRAKKLAAATKE
jgi:hypothetical protein